MRCQLMALCGGDQPIESWTDVDGHPLETRLADIAVGIVVHGERVCRSSAEHYREWVIKRKAEIVEEERAFTRFEGGCILCATIEAELVDGKRVLWATDDVVCISPFWAGTPYELLIIPRSHDLHLTDSNEETLRGMGIALRDAVVALREVHGDVAYNIVFHTAPHHYNGAYHWHVHLFPKLVTTAGFERGTGVMINIVPPETAAERLRSVTVKA